MSHTGNWTEIELPEAQAKNFRAKGPQTNVPWERVHHVTLCTLSFQISSPRMAFPFFPCSRICSLRTSHLEKTNSVQATMLRIPECAGGHVADLHPDLETCSTDSSPPARSRMHTYGLTPTSVLQKHRHQGWQLSSLPARHKTVGLLQGSSLVFLFKKFGLQEQN